jgi:RNA polymerase sigma-70 factor, ECF subfamily
LEFYDQFDDDYLERLRREDYLTQQHFVAYFGKLLEIKLRSRIRSLPDREDCAQVVFARFFQNLHKGSIQDGQRLGAYVISICNNVIREYRRRREEEQIDDFVADAIPDATNSALDKIEERERAKMVQEILDDLPERDRRILREIYFAERNKDAVCEEYGITRGSLRVIVMRAIRRFREKLPKKPPGPTGKAAD